MADMIQILITVTSDDAREIVANSPSAIDRLKGELTKALAFADDLAWPDPPALTIYRDQVVLKYYDEALADHVEHAIFAAVRSFQRPTCEHS
jgi:hypothetical protein